MASDSARKPTDEQHHVPHKLGQAGAKALISLMNRHHPPGKLIHRVCIEYVRLPSHYYRPFIIGNSQTSANRAGKILTDFMVTLNNHHKLSRGCVLQFARHPSDRRWPSAIANYQSVFEYVAKETNPLYIAGERTQERLNETLSQPYDHQRELHERTKVKSNSPRLTHPFVQFIFPTQRFRQQFVAPRPLITGSPSTTATGSPSTTAASTVTPDVTTTPALTSPGSPFTTTMTAVPTVTPDVTPASATQKAFPNQTSSA